MISIFLLKITLEADIDLIIELEKYAIMGYSYACGNRPTMQLLINFKKFSCWLCTKKQVKKQ